MTSEEAREQMAAVILQKNFRMWMAQANLIRLQLNSAGTSKDSDRIVFPQQTFEVLFYLKKFPILLDSIHT
jgi:hypothetical protein